MLLGTVLYLGESNVMPCTYYSVPCLAWPCLTLFLAHAAIPFIRLVCIRTASFALHLPSLDAERLSVLLLAPIPSSPWIGILFVRSPPSLLACFPAFLSSLPETPTLQCVENTPCTTTTLTLTHTDARPAGDYHHNKRLIAATTGSRLHCDASFFPVSVFFFSLALALLLF